MSNFYFKPVVRDLNVKGCHTGAQKLVRRMQRSCHVAYEKALYVRSKRCLHLGYHIQIVMLEYAIVTGAVAYRCVENDKINTA